MYAGSVYTGVEFSKRLCGISVIRRYQLFSKKYFLCMLVQVLTKLMNFALTKGEKKSDFV